MIRHIVFWKLKDEANGMSKEANGKEIKQRLEALAGQIEGLIRIEVGIDFLHSPESADLALYSEFESRQALDFYQQHPLHKAIMPFIAEARNERRVVDYEG
jgi:hypothetical protein